MSKKTTTTTKKTVSLVDSLAFWSIIFLALVMVLNVVMALLGKVGITINGIGRISSILNKIALAIAIAITLMCSYFSAKRRSKKVFVIWVVCAILVGLSFILGITVFRV